MFFIITFILFYFVAYCFMKGFGSFLDGASNKTTTVYNIDEMKVLNMSTPKINKHYSNIRNVN